MRYTPVPNLNNIIDTNFNDVLHHAKNDVVIAIISYVIKANIGI